MASINSEQYRNYTKPAELDKAISTLKGLVKGISLDGVFDEKETHELCNGISIHEHLRTWHPFNEIFILLDSAMADGVMDNEERENLLWYCQQITGRREYYDDITTAIQYLCGIVHGMLSDGELTDKEIHALKDWLDNTDFLQGTYPFDELTSILTSILSDHRIDENERNTLKAFLGELVEFKESYNLSENYFKSLREKYTVQGICALCPDIIFSERRFVFTGDSNKASRDDFFEIVKEKGGIPLTAVSGKTDYLIVGNAGNPCWAFSCYGRKIEKAMQLRRQGAKIQIINENDFWDAIYDS